ncbi:hypothetical protein BS78_07G060200 [Paspalum vaginatum]|nr:hypothetical protein BS78_07G060200 [Paspalum vaginatum]
MHVVDQPIKLRLENERENKGAPASRSHAGPHGQPSGRSLAEVFRRLGSPSTLARAACICRRWRRVASAPAFLSLFRRLHPPPLLSFFICNDGFTVKRVSGGLVGEIVNPTFLATNRQAPRGLSAAVGRCTRFSLASLPDVDRWALADTRDGLLLLCSSFSSHDRLQIPGDFVVCDPVTGRSVLLSGAPIFEVDDESAYQGAALLLPDGGASGRLCFEVVVVTYFMWGRACCVGEDMHADGCVYWVIDDEKHEDSAYLLALDTRAKAFSTIRLLSSMRARYEGNMRVVRTDGGELRLVALADDGMALDFWRLDRSRSSRGRWVRDARRELAHAQGAMDLVLEAAEGCKTVIMDAAEGFVFFKHFGSPRVFVLHLDAMVLMPLPHPKYYSGPALPYRLALQPPFPVLD